MMFEVIVGSIVVVTAIFIGYSLYDYFYKGGTVQALTADALIAEAKNVVTELEAFVQSEAKKVEDYVSQKTGLETTIANVQADIQKAQDFANKVKALF